MTQSRALIRTGLILGFLVVLALSIWPSNAQAQQSCLENGFTPVITSFTIFPSSIPLTDSIFAAGGDAMATVTLNCEDPLFGGFLELTDDSAGVLYYCPDTGCTSYSYPPGLFSVTFDPNSTNAQSTATFLITSLNCCGLLPRPALTYQITAYYYEYYNDVSTTATANITVLPPPPPTAQSQVVASVTGGPTETAQANGSPINAHFPLGAQFTLSLQDTQGNPIPASYSLGTASLASGVDQDALFPGLATLQYTTQPDPSSGQFQAVHLGTVPLTIVPNDGATPAVNLTISIEKPAALGSDHNDFDPGLTALAHSTGVPPQFIKGQIAQEGEFNPYSFRYEPLNLSTGDLNVSRGKDLRGALTYSQFRLPTIGDSLDPGNCKTYPDVNLEIPDQNCLGFAQGIDFSQHEMDVITGPNQNFHLRTWTRDPATGILVLDGNGNPIARQLGPNDRYVSASDVLQASDKIFHWIKHKTAPRVPLVTFTGGFPLAGSYGLLQMMYVTSIDEGVWKGVNPPCDGATDPLDPSGLYDTTCNLTNGGGSLGVGTRKVRGDFSKKYGPSPTEDTSSTLESSFTYAYSRYNPGEIGYGGAVISRANDYVPTTSGPIFVLGGTQ